MPIDKTKRNEVVRETRARLTEMMPGFERSVRELKGDCDCGLGDLCKAELALALLKGKGTKLQQQVAGLVLHGIFSSRATAEQIGEAIQGMVEESLSGRLDGAAVAVASARSRTGH